MTDRELLKTEFSDMEIKELREIFSRNDTKCTDFATKTAKMARQEGGDNCWF